jgi:PAS domain S-box-containing protein
MGKFNLFTKIITPIIVIGVAFSYIGFLYLNTVIETTINHEIEQKLDNKIHYTYDHIESEYRLLFYLYGTSAGDYTAQSKIVKEEILKQLRTYTIKTEDILYIIDPNEYRQLSNKSLLSSELAGIIREDKSEIIIDQITYRVEQIYFKPWDWRIVYLLNTKSFEDLLNKNKTTLLSIIYSLLFILIILIVTTFKIFIKNPIDILLEHFKAITQGKYTSIDKKYNTKEIDLLIDDVNFMTKSIMYREEESSTLLTLTKQNEEYMKDILSSQSSIIIINDMTEILDVNDSFLKFFHEFKSLDEFKMQHSCVCDYFVEEEGFIYSFSDKNWVEFILEDSKNLHKVKIYKDNQYYTYTIQAKKSEKYNRIIITMTDITELEKSTALLEQYKKAVDAGAIVSKADLKGKITYVNDKLINISGYTKEELIGANHNIVRSEKSSSAIFKDMWKTIQNKQIWHGHIENKRKDGTPYFVSATIVPILDENNNIYEYVALRYDITEQVLDKQKAQKAENAKTNFLANMSHEIRTPLNAIIGFTKLLLNFDLAQKESKYINIIDQSAQSLLGITNDILDLSKIENGSLIYEKIEFNPFLEFESVINLFMINANEKSISLVSFIDPMIPQSIIGDPLRLKQVLSNLISNAIKFTPKEGTIFSRIELISKGEKSCKVRISIQDSGIGITKEKQKLIFEEFSQADDSTSREYGGTGLGLSISNKIVKALGSNIQVDSEEGKGSKFFFDIEFETYSSADKHLLEFKKLQVAILEPTAIDPLQCNILKEYLESLCNVIEIQSINATDKILEQDIVFVDESSITKSLIDLESDTTNFVVLSKDKESCDKFENGIILNIPLNASALFDILVSFVDYDSFIDGSLKSEFNLFNGTVLVAEDHEINQQLIAALLDIRGIQYSFANNGNEAIELFKKGKYDLILMDINMPEKNGVEATIEIINIEKKDSLEHTPIVALTANVIEADKQKIMDIGTDDYLYKPIDEKKLDEVLNRYLTKTSQSDIEVDVSYSLEDASANMGIDSTIVKTIVANFCKGIDKDLEALKNAISEDNFEEIENYSHKIKGAALNLRMEKVAKFAHNIEAVSIEKNNTKIEENFVNLTKAVKAVQESMV